MPEIVREAENSAFTITVSGRAKGSHSTAPPIAELERMVEEWLRKQVYHRMNACYELQVECARVPIKNTDEGWVKIIAMADWSPKVVEVRIHPPGDEFQWRGFLVCPTPDHALRAFFVNRRAVDEALLAMKESYEKSDSEPEPVKEQPVFFNRKVRRKAGYYNSQENDIDHHTSIRKRETLRHISGVLEEELAGDLLISVDTVAVVFQKVFGHDRFSPIDCLPIMLHLMLGGILVPSEKSYTFYEMTDLGHEYARDWRNRVREAELKKVQDGQKTNDRLQAAAQKEIGGLERKLQNARSSLIDLQERRAELDRREVQLSEPLP